MALQGTLSDFGLDEVLRMLELGKKHGRLRVTGGPGETTGNLWVDGGNIVGSALGAEPASGDHIEALFQLLRLEQGEFHFHGEESVTTAESPEAIGDTLEASTARLAEWRELAKVLPSQEHWLTLSSTIATSLTIEPAQWAVLAKVGSGMQVSQCVEEVGLGLVPSCRVIVELVDRSLLTVSEDMPARVVEVARRVDPQLPSVGAVDPAEVAASEPEPAAEEGDPPAAATTPAEPAEPAGPEVEPASGDEPAPSDEEASAGDDTAASDDTAADGDESATDDGDATAATPEGDDVNPRALLRLLNSVK